MKGASSVAELRIFQTLISPLKVVDFLSLAKNWQHRLSYKKPFHRRLDLEDLITKKLCKSNQYRLLWEDYDRSACYRTPEALQMSDGVQSLKN